MRSAEASGRPLRQHCPQRGLHRLAPLARGSQNRESPPNAAHALHIWLWSARAMRPASDLAPAGRVSIEFIRVCAASLLPSCRRLCSLRSCLPLPDRPTRSPIPIPTADTPDPPRQAGCTRLLRGLVGYGSRPGHHRACGMADLQWRFAARRPLATSTGAMGLADDRHESADHAHRVLGDLWAPTLRLDGVSLLDPVQGRAALQLAAPSCASRPGSLIPLRSVPWAPRMDRIVPADAGARHAAATRRAASCSLDRRSRRRTIGATRDDGSSALADWLFSQPDIRLQDARGCAGRMPCHARRPGCWSWAMSTSSWATAWAAIARLRATPRRLGTFHAERRSGRAAAVGLALAGAGRLAALVGEIRADWPHAVDVGRLPATSTCPSRPTWRTRPARQPVDGAGKGAWRRPGWTCAWRRWRCGWPRRCRR